ncbi:MAG: flagellar basal body-associated FliL family protein [Azoarcus sp.]|jgi:flagellar FliL protein|nr:flagellar basal body-associated FliL family protein [Azoarcus sp.]
MAQAAKPSSAKTDTSENAPASPPPAPVKRNAGKWLLIILLVAVVVLILLVAAVGAFLVLRKNHSNGDTASHEPAPAAQAPAAVPVAPPFTPAIDLTKPPVFVPLDPFTVNLRPRDADDDSHYLQTTIILRVTDAKTAEALKGWMPEIQDRINRLLSSKNLTDVQNDMSHEHMQSEIMGTLNTLFGVPPPPPDVPQGQTTLGPIQGVLFKTFIIQ